MLLESIKLENFRQFRNESIDFAQGQDGKNVTIICRPNHIHLLWMLLCRPLISVELKQFARHYPIPQSKLSFLSKIPMAISLRNTWARKLVAVIALKRKMNLKLS